MPHYLISYMSYTKANLATTMVYTECAYYESIGLWYADMIKSCPDKSTVLLNHTEITEEVYEELAKGGRKEE